MAIKVTLQCKAGKSRRKEYKTKNRAFLAIKKWLLDNEGIAMVYEPFKEPVVYRNSHEIPFEERTKTSSFYNTREWLDLRVRVIANSDGRCVLCGASREHGAELHVDHIKPRSRYPKQALDISNLQVLCAECNIGKAATIL